MKKIVKCLIWMVLMLSLSLVVSCSETNPTNRTINTVPNTTSQEENLSNSQGSIGETSSIVSNVVSGTQTQPQASSSSVKTTYTISLMQPTGGTISVNKTTASLGEEITLSNTQTKGIALLHIA